MRKTAEIDSQSYHARDHEAGREDDDCQFQLADALCRFLLFFSCLGLFFFWKPVLPWYVPSFFSLSIFRKEMASALNSPHFFLLFRRFSVKVFGHAAWNGALCELNSFSVDCLFFCWSRYPAGRQDSCDRLWSVTGLLPGLFFASASLFSWNLLWTNSIYLILFATFSWWFRSFPCPHWKSIPWNVAARLKPHIKRAGFVWIRANVINQL